MKKKLGIITFSNTLDNYGQVLQYLATQEYLSQRGHEVFLYQSLGHKKWSIFRLKRKLRKMIKFIYNLFQKSSCISIKNKHNDRDVQVVENEEEKLMVFRRWTEITEKYERTNPRYFERFRSRNFNVLKCYYEDLDGFYAFAVGSDQTWSYLSEDTMLDFVPSKVRRFSLASSIGHKVFTSDEIRRAKDSLNKFDFLTVREQSGLDFCFACGRCDAQIVLDPSFLLKKKDYEKFVDTQEIEVQKPYVFIYLLGADIAPSIADMFLWAKDNNLEVVYVASQGREDDFPKKYATVEQWLYLLKNAEYVFTNSYHGMSLSIIYHKQFLTFPLVGLMEQMNGRILQLSQVNRLNNRIYKGDFNDVKEPVDWDYVDKNISDNFIKIDNLLKSVNL